MDTVVKHSTKTYKTGKSKGIAPNGLDQAAMGGEALTIIDQLGFNKTFQLNMTGGMDRPTAGSVILDGARIVLENSELRHARDIAREIPDRKQSRMLLNAIRTRCSDTST